MFYDTFSALCVQNGVSPNKACIDCAISRTSVAKWKKGATPNGATVSKIADYFGVTTDYLLGNEQKEEPLVNGDKELTEYLEMLKNRSECRMLFKLAKTATKEDVEQAVKIIEALRK